MLFMRLPAVIFLIVIFVGQSVPLDAAPKATAGRLFVAAGKLIERAKAAKDPAERAKLWTEAERNLNRVVKEFPASALATRLAAGKSVGGLSVNEVSIAAQSARCNVALAPACLFDHAAALAARFPDAATRNRLLGAIAELRAWSGDVAGGTRIARRISDPPGRVKALRTLPGPRNKPGLSRVSRVVTLNFGGIADPYTFPLLIRRQIRIGDTKGLDFTLNRLVQESRYLVSIDQRWPQILISSFKAVLLSGRAAVAVAVAKRNSDAQARAETVTLLAVAAAQAGKTALARKLIASASEDIKTVAPGKLRPRVIAQLGWAEAGVGRMAAARAQLSKARALAMKSPYVGVRLGHLVENAAIRVAIGDTAIATRLLDQTLKLAERAKYGNPDNFLYQLTDIAIARAAAGDLTGARKIFARVERVGFREPFYSHYMELAVFRTGIGDRTGALKDLDRAISLIRTMTNTEESQSNSRRADVAKLRMVLGDPSGAVAAANLISSDEERIKALAHLAVWLSLK